MERSITQAEADDGSVDLKPRTRVPALSNAWWGVALVLVCFAAYFLIQTDHSRPFVHFVLQAQAWLDGHTSIPMPDYQDVMPIYDAFGNPTGQGIIPFPPLPAWVLLPFVAIWHYATSQQLLSTLFAAIDVGLAYWMLGYLPISQKIRRLTALFLGLGTVLWFTAATGSTWFWAHIVAVACLIISVGLALSADKEAAEPRPLGEGVSAVRRSAWPGGWWSVALLIALGFTGEMLFVLAGSDSSAAALAGVGALLGLLAAALAVVVAGRPGALAPFVIAVAVIGGLPALLIAGAASTGFLAVIDAGLIVLVVLAGAVLWFGRRRRGRMRLALNATWAAISSPEVVQVSAGIFFGLAVTARLTILFGFPFLILVGGGGTWLRRAMLAGAGAAVPLVSLLVITYATSGQLFNPAYDYLYKVELTNATIFNYNPQWSISDIRYIPQSLMIMLFEPPRIMPDLMGIYPGYGDPVCVAGTTRGLFDASCPVAVPNAVGMSIILASPAYLLAPFSWLSARSRMLDRATVGATIAVLGIAVVNLMHFSQGWVQFGYRFSNDFVPFALILVAVGASRMGRLWPFVLLVAASIAINFWGTMWGATLGW